MDSDCPLTLLIQIAEIVHNLQTSYLQFFECGYDLKFSTLLLLRLAYQSLGVVYGDLGTSPLYVYNNTFPHGIGDPEDVIGALSLIIYSLTLIPLLKYVFIVCRANDNGQEYLKLNPLAYVPTLVDGDAVIVDSFAIIMYLEEKYPQRALLPQDHQKKAINYQSEYAAWTLVNGYALNHVTISTHCLRSNLRSIGKLNQFIEENGFNLNYEGGILKVSPDGLLLQSSTVRVVSRFKFHEWDSTKFAMLSLALVEFASWKLC
ncbi:hypothetical protein FXO37_26225 [Capsicum annuum]|nr:hypothetical protein FXO37_26225 [Capsicum annuum]